MLNSQLFAKCGYLWPSSVFKHSPVDEFQILTVRSSLPLARSPVLDQATVLTVPLPFSQMSGNTYVMVVYASPPLSGGQRERYLWPSSVALHAPDSTSQILRVLSHDADTMVLPWGAKTHAETTSLPFF
jgi:hypothetical protein